MERIRAVVKKWGNSFGLILPKKIVDAEKIKEGKEISIFIDSDKKMTVGDVFKLARKTLLPKLNRSTQEIMDEIDGELWSSER